MKLVAGDLVRLTLKRPFSDGIVALDLDPLSLLVRLAMSVPATPSDYTWFVTSSRGGDDHNAEPTEPPPLAPSRGPPFFKSQVIRRRLGEPVQAALFDAH